MEVEAIGHVRHKNLVRLLGYCIEGTHRYFLFVHIMIPEFSTFGLLRVCLVVENCFHFPRKRFQKMELSFHF